MSQKLSRTIVLSNSDAALKLSLGAEPRMRPRMGPRIWPRMGHMNGASYRG